jgi:hypothetical protein
MIDGDYRFSRARWRDGIEEERDPAVGGSPPKTHEEPGVAAPNEDPEDDTYTAHLAMSRDTCLETSASLPSHDYDRCVFDPNPGGLAATMKPSTLFLREPNDVDEIVPADVQQGGLGDCHLLAPLAAMASTPEGRAAIRRAIDVHKNDRGEVVGYTVTLHDGGRPRPFDVPVGAPYVVGHAIARSDEPEARTGSYETWPLVVEKAYAQLRHGYNVIGRSAEVSSALEALTGRPVIRLAASEVGGDLGSDPHQVVVLSSKHDIARTAFGLEAGHAYAVVGRQIVAGKVLLTLYNPWGERGGKDRPIRPTLVPLGRLGEWFDSVDIASVGATP